MGSLRVKPPILVIAALVLVAGLVAGAFVARTSSKAAPASADATSQPASPQPGFPFPPRGAVVYARQWGGDALALGVVPHGGSSLVQASVLGPQGRGVSGLAVSLNGRRAAACGIGCYRATLRPSPRTIELRVRSTAWRVSLPAQWPPRDGTTIVQRATAVWKSLQSLTLHEHLASDAVHATTSTWRIQAPDKVAYQVVDGPDGIVVGDKRWDRDSNAKRWVQSPQTPLTQPTPAWVGSRDAHVLGTGTLGGRAVWRISFFDPGTPAWFAIAVDRQTGRTLDSHMITTAHFMHDRYSAFNRTPAIVPPG